MKYEVVCTENYLDVGLLIEPKRILARASTYSSENEYGGIESITWINTGIFLSKNEWKYISYNKATDQILNELGINKTPIKTHQNNNFKLCPLMINNNSNCIGNDCSWFCKWADDCSIPLLAGMFADSTICQSVFEKHKK